MYITRIILIFCLGISCAIGSLPAQADLVLPAPGQMVRPSAPFSPVILKGLKVHPEVPFKFDFILDLGSSSPSSSPNAFIGDPQQEQLKTEATKLIKYFLASLTTPEKDLWVNLSPYEKDRIIPDAFGQTEMGRDLLAQDYILKQITASLIYPEGDLGKKFWKRIYEEAQKKFGSTNIPVNTFNKVWIIPEKAVVYENAKAGTAYVVESKLKVMLEQDYLAVEKNTTNTVIPAKAGTQKRINSDMDPRFRGNDKIEDSIASQIIRELIIPILEKEINQGKNFAQLRQVYNSLILATWYKKKIKDSILSKVYTDKNKTLGLIPHNPQLTQTQIYNQYLQAFKKGAYNYIREEPDPITKQSIPRKYFSGGVQINPSLAMTTANSNELPTHLDHAMRVTLDLVMTSMDLNNASRDKAMAIHKENYEAYSFLRQYEGKAAPYPQKEMSKKLGLSPQTLSGIYKKYGILRYEPENIRKLRRWAMDNEGRDINRTKDSLRQAFKVRENVLNRMLGLYRIRVFGEIRANKIQVFWAWAKAHAYQKINKTQWDIADDFGISQGVVGPGILANHITTLGGIGVKLRASLYQWELRHRGVPGKIQWGNFSHEIHVKQEDIVAVLREWMGKDHEQWSPFAQAIRRYVFSHTRLTAKHAHALAAAFLTKDDLVRFDRYLMEEGKRHEEILKKFSSRRLHAEDSSDVKFVLLGFDVDRRDEILGKIHEFLMDEIVRAQAKGQQEDLYHLIERYDWVRPHANLTKLRSECLFDLRRMRQPTNRQVYEFDHSRPTSKQRDLIAIDADEKESYPSLGVTIRVNIFGKSASVQATTINGALESFWNLYSASSQDRARVRKAIKEKTCVVIFNGQKVDLLKVIDTHLEEEINSLSIEPQQPMVPQSAGLHDLDMASPAMAAKLIVKSKFYLTRDGQERTTHIFKRDGLIIGEYSELGHKSVPEGLENKIYAQFMQANRLNRNGRINAAMVSVMPEKRNKNTGGIDLTADKTHIEIEGEGGIKFNVDPAMLQRFQDAPGVEIKGMTITPLTNLREFLGLESLPLLPQKVLI